MRNSAVVTFQFLFRNEMYGCVIVWEVVWHSLDIVLDLCKICAFFCNYEALSCMFLSCCKIWVLSISYCFQCGFYRDCILFCIFNTFDTANCIWVSLAYTFAPECVIFTVCKNCVCIETVQWEHSRIPANGDNSDMSAFFCSSVYCIEVLWNSCMCIETVNYVEHFCIFWCLFRKICCTSSTNDHNIDLIFHFLSIVYRVYCSCLCKDFNCFRSTACKYCHQLHIWIMFNCTLYTTAKITVA